ncbi:S9 family peptidase [Mangrovimonas aestuarii]|uniref:S9 family peptidase n=1 Tax=Mangrovimonas aestuarii TaxID=3018443 RepID=UPI002379B55A|nr:S9 family peptidase [Mangrovimonas aestuarii]
MKKLLFITFAVILCVQANSQVMTPELLWNLERLSPIGLTNDGESVIYKITTYNVDSNSSSSKLYVIPISGGAVKEINGYDDIYTNTKINTSGAYELVSKPVKVKKVSGTDFYPNMKKSNILIYDNLNYRHWDTWEDGEFNHLFLKDIKKPSAELRDIMEEEPFSTPTEPFGGAEDYVWSKDGTKVFYVCKKEYGTQYAVSTNTDIYQYDVNTKITTNLSEGNLGYDTQPAVAIDGSLAWLQMDEPGYESDKNDIIVWRNGEKTNLTKNWDGTVSGFLWSNDAKHIYFVAPTKGTQQLFVVDVAKKGNPKVSQLTNGQWDVTGIVGQSGKTMVVTRTDMNHASEIYKVNLRNGDMQQLTHVNDEAYKQIKLSKVEKRMVSTTDGKQMVTWVIYPPNFDPSKKYPTLLYCQGGPQSPLSQFYSFRWNFQLMAANGYIVVAPNRRGMPGHGVAWNEQISGNWGGQNIQDYLSAIDNVAKESYVDKSRLGCIGASYGGYSVFYLAGHHNKRFKSFIAHDGIFNTRSMYGTTEEMFFVNKDLDGPYWKSPTPRAYTDYNPVNYVDKWDTPIMIIQGGIDFRVPIGQGLEAFQAAQLRGIKSKLLFFPEENHWILSAQNGIIWQKEFFKWLEETLN